MRWQLQPFITGRPGQLITGQRATGQRATRLWRAVASAMAVACCLGVIGGCGRGPAEPPSSAVGPAAKLSAYGLFVGNGATQQPAAGVIRYTINTPLFSDYATKYRFVKLPQGASATYDETEVFDFPVGTVIAKTFACPHDMTDPSKGRDLLETRILKHDPDGWVGLPYVWNKEQTEATLQVAGGRVELNWIHSDGQPRHSLYLIPNKNQCKGCHKHREKTMLPIGPKARQLNRDVVYEEGTENQLAHWTRIGALSGAPDPSKAPRLAVWDDPSTGSLDQRARAYLEGNCAHCHNPHGPARNTGLNLLTSAERPYVYGIFKAPVAAGLGSGGRLYDIVPGKPDESIMPFRMASTHPGIVMPELGKRLVHDEGVELIREWISQMKTPESARTN